MFAASANQILAVVNASRIKYGIWWMCNMASGTDRSDADGVGGDFPVQEPVSWSAQGRV